MTAPSENQRDINVWLVCTGVGVVDGGIETFARECFDGLHGRSGLRLQYQESIDLLEAIGMAGGSTRIAQPAKVTIKRHVNGSDQVFTVDAKKMARDPHAEQFSVQQGDTITLAESIL